MNGPESLKTRPPAQKAWERKKYGRNLHIKRWKRKPIAKNIDRFFLLRTRPVFSFEIGIIYAETRENHNFCILMSGSRRFPYSAVLLPSLNRDGFPKFIKPHLSMGHSFLLPQSVGKLMQLEIDASRSRREKLPRFYGCGASFFSLLLFPIQITLKI